MSKKIGKQKNMFRCRLALRQKKVPASLTWWHSSSEVLIFFALWFSADSRTQKLNSDKFDQWRIRRRMWRNMYICTSGRSFSHKVTMRRFGPQHPTLTPGAGSKTEVGRSIYIYIYIYMGRLMRKGTQRPQPQSGEHRDQNRDVPLICM